MRDVGYWVKRGALRLLLYPHRIVPGALRRQAAGKAFANGATFGELSASAHRLAGRWRSQGAVVGDRVLLDVPNDRAFVEARLAGVLGGFVLVPVPPGTSDERLGWMAEFAEARAYLGPRSDALPGVAFTHLDVLADDRAAYEAALHRARPSRSSPAVGASSLLTINFTSGTTGEPKGVMSTVAGWGWSLYYALLENRSPIEPGEVFLHAIPLATAGSSLILPAVLSGATSVFLPRWDAEEAAALVERARVTRIFLTPTLLAEFVDVVRASGTDVSSLRSVIYGTEGIPPARIRKAMETLGPVLQQGYGMAEALPPVCVLQISEHARAVGEGDVKLLSSAGRPTRAVNLKIFGADDQPLPPGAVGSIRVKGKTVSPGYWKRPDLTEESRRSGYYITGDAGYLDDRGYLHVLGRAGAILSEPARNAWDWLEAQPEVCLAWVDEGREGKTLHLVPARGKNVDTVRLAEEVRRFLSPGEPLRLQLEPCAPKTSAYKLDIRRSGPVPGR